MKIIPLPKITDPKAKQKKYFKERLEATKAELQYYSPVSKSETWYKRVIVHEKWLQELIKGL